MIAPRPAATRLTVGVGDLIVSDDPDAEIITHALGSCIGVTIHDPVAQVGGMLHFMLPESRSNPERAAQSPAMYGDTGIPLLFRSCYELGAHKQRLVVCAAGGAEILDPEGVFKVGMRNRTILRKLFWKNQVLMAAEDTGGNHSRTLTLNLRTGAVTIRSQGKLSNLWSPEPS